MTNKTFNLPELTDMHNETSDALAEYEAHESAIDAFPSGTLVPEYVAAAPVQVIAAEPEEAQRIIEGLYKLYDSRLPAGGMHDQIIGLGPYIIRASGETFQILIEAANLIMNRALSPAQPVLTAEQKEPLTDY